MAERTTVRLPEDLLNRARRKAAAERRTLTSLIEDGLRLVVSEDRKPPKTKRVLPRISKARGGPMPGIELAENSVSSIPGIGPPLALLIRGRTRLVFGGFRSSLTTSRSPSSISEVRVRRSAAALRLARLRRSSGSLTVVRSAICPTYHTGVSVCQFRQRPDTVSTRCNPLLGSELILVDDAPPSWRA